MSFFSLLQRFDYIQTFGDRSVIADHFSTADSHPAGKVFKERFLFAVASLDEFRRDSFFLDGVVTFSIAEHYRSLWTALLC